MNRFTVPSVAAAVALAAFASGCKEAPKPAAPAPGGPAGGAAAPAAQNKEDHPNAVPLGTTTAGGLTLAATQDDPVKAGGECAFDLKVTGYPPGGKPKAVRFWVGVETGEGSAKARADEESPDTWHTHVEVPNPIPAGGKFWAEVEPAAGEKVRVSFALKP